MNPGLNREKGFTLVELIIAVALIGLVLSLAFLLYAYGLGSFDTGTAQADFQQKARLVDTLFKKELRNAGALTLAPTKLEAEYDGFFYLENGSFYRNSAPVTEDITDIQVKITRESGRSILTFNITSGAGAQEFNLHNQFILNNISAAFDSSYDDYRSLNEFVLYYDPEIPPAPPAEQFTLTVAVDGQGTTVPAPGNHAYDADSLIALTAEPESGWTFEKWMVDTQQYDDPLVPVLMDRDRTAIAYFHEEEGSDPGLEAIIAQINTLPFQNSPTDNEPIVIVPQAEGVIFRFIRSTAKFGQIIIASNQKNATIIRHNNQDGSGTITLEAEKDGETVEKVFDVAIPARGEGAVTITAE